MTVVAHLDVAAQVADFLGGWGNTPRGLFSESGDVASSDASSTAIGDGKAERIVQSLGYILSQGEIRSPQGVSAGMFSRRLAHIRVDFSVAPPADHRAAIIGHEVAHALDPGPYDFDHPWAKTEEEIVQAQHAQLVACLSSHAFTRGVLGVNPGPGQLALARYVLQVLEHLGAREDLPGRGIEQRVESVVCLMAEAMTAPTWVRSPDREIAVDRGVGVMWLSVGVAASDDGPPSGVASVATRHCAQARSRYADDPRFTADLDTARPVA
ncbi:hypothetical protein VT50_0210070 [Streptomyces antioxidans]|uniref:Uncharacterized protein n=1 Tax=Streptomyces antioxidans TaxID=1507734 RepID=A0A1V4D8A6_9ACTN|nr:hypothetical protein [Streptomyces antioxidans]OPF81408.1 hypothetical protein VT50_0210070 [Streptomyces antioxidans]